MRMILKQFLNVKCVKINSCRLEEDAKNKELKNIVINVSVTKGQRCRCPVCGKKSARYDKGRETRRWRALDMGPCKVYVESEAPRVMCREHGGAYGPNSMGAEERVIHKRLRGPGHTDSRTSGESA